MKSKLFILIFGMVLLIGRVSAFDTYINNTNIFVNGSVGIGTNSPAVKFEISDTGTLQIRNENTDSAGRVILEHQMSSAAGGAKLDLRSHGSSYSELFFGVNISDSNLIISSNNNLLAIGNSDNVPLIFGTNNLERMRINGSGHVGIGTTTPVASAILDLTSTNKGFLPPRMNTTHRDAISFPADGLMVYDNATEKISVREDGVWAEVLSNRDYYVASSSSAATPATGSFQNLALGTVNRDPGGNDAGANNYYSVPRDGMYMTNIRMRADGETAGADFGIGVHSTNADGNHFWWTGVNGDIAREVWSHTYVAHYSEGDVLRPIAYLDGTAMTFDSYEMAIVPLS